MVDDNALALGVYAVYLNTIYGEYSNEIERLISVNTTGKVKVHTGIVLPLAITDG